jgi:hypothetical protein
MNEPQPEGTDSHPQIQAAWEWWRDCGYGTADGGTGKQWALLWRSLPAVIRWARDLDRCELVTASDRLPDALALELLR